MRIKKLQIKNFKSLVDFELADLKPFCAFVGPNASGKSNIFEALEFTNYFIRYHSEAPGFFGGTSSILSFSASGTVINHADTTRPDLYSRFISFQYDFTDKIRIYATGFIDERRFQNQFFAISSTGNPGLSLVQIKDIEAREKFVNEWLGSGEKYNRDYEQFVDNFSRLFVGNPNINKSPVVNGKLLADGKNLAQIIGRIFENNRKRGDFIEWLRILIPEFKDIEVKKSNIDGSYDFFVYEKASVKPFPRNLISDGTYNILAIMAAVYQTNDPQFICIEEPENGLHPQGIELLVDFFREKCEEEGHHIWLNTHSPTLVRCLEIDEIILVNKVNGATRAKQLTQNDKIDIRTDEAWLTNALGGGVL